MWRRLLATTTTGLALTTAYVVYSGMVSSMVRLPERLPEPTLTSEPANTLRPVENVRVASEWLPDEPWAAQAKYQLRTDVMFVYANEWTPNGDEGLIQFRPFAAVWLSEDEDGVQQAVTVTAESALLKFQSSFEFDNPQPGRVIGGSLFGAVRITGPDGLELLGKDFFFLEGTSSLYSNSEVEFKLGRNHGDAGKLLVHLIKADSPVLKDRPNVVGIESVELRQIVTMHLSLDEKHPEDGPVTVKCTDRFIYRVEQRTATFEKNVLAYRRVGQPKKLEQLHCDQLSVRFEPKQPPAENESRTAKPASPARKSRDEFQAPDGNLEFRQLIAEGKPAQNGKPAPVFLESEPQQLKAWMQRLEYDAQLRTITMQSPEDVKVEQEGNRLVCPEIHIILGEDGKSVSEAVCRGAGMIARYSPEGELLFAADWLKQLRKSTDPETQLDLIELEQDAVFRQPEHDTALSADQIRLWFTPPDSGGGDSGLRLMNQGENTLPKRLLALRQVAFVSPKVEYEGEQMEVLFDDGTLATHEEKQPLSDRARSRKTKADRNRGKESAKSAPSEGKATPASDDSSAADSPPMEVFADKMRVRILPVKSPEEQPQLAEIWAAGKVRVVQPSDAGGLPIVVTGDRLHLTNNSEADQVVHVYGEPGRPAQVRDEQQRLHMEGQAIGLDRAANLAWVDGAGLLRLPVPKTLDGQDLPEPQMLDVWWKEWMDFDGLLASFEGDVRAKLEGGTMLCRTMQVELTQPVSFGAANADEARPEVKTVLCRDGVELENHHLEDKKLVEIQKAKVWEFHLDNVTGDADAKGPGWMQMWRRGNGKRAGLAVTEEVRANEVSREPAPQWEYTRVDFAGDMQGNVGRKITSFHDRVKVLYGPVERPVDVISRHELPKEGGFMECDTLEFLQVASPVAKKSFVQLRGVGDTRLEGRGYSGRAQQISYDETKGQIVLRSFGSYQATIWRDQVGDKQPQSVDAQQMQFIPAINRLTIVNSTGGEGGQ